MVPIVGQNQARTGPELLLSVANRELHSAAHASYLASVLNAKLKLCGFIESWFSLKTFPMKRKRRQKALCASPELTLITRMHRSESAPILFSTELAGMTRMSDPEPGASARHMTLSRAQKQRQRQRHRYWH